MQQARFSWRTPKSGLEVTGFVLALSSRICPSITSLRPRDSYLHLESPPSPALPASPSAVGGYLQLPHCFILGPDHTLSAPFVPWGPRFWSASPPASDCLSSPCPLLPPGEAWPGCLSGLHAEAPEWDFSQEQLSNGL